MVQIVTVFPGTDGESCLINVTPDQFAEIINHIGEGPTRLNQSQSPSVDAYQMFHVSSMWCTWRASPRLKWPTGRLNASIPEIF